tara:strand:+ start:2410 stop:2727 length:318 start_codon:yes stop_codon:yes gene_type:complete
MNTTQNETAILSTKDIDIMRKDDVRNEMAILSAMDTVRRLEERIDRLERGRVMEDFKENVYELAFGDDAINKDYTDKEVIDKLFQNLQSLQQYVEEFGEMFGEEK